MHTLKVLSISFALIFCISMLYGCGSDSNNGDLSMRFLPVMSESQSNHQPEPEPSDISLFVERIDSLDLDHSAGTRTIQLKANCDWSISFRESSNNKETKEIDWIKAEPSSGTDDCEVTLTFEDNKTSILSSEDNYCAFIEDRFCELVVTSESRTVATASIKQEGVTYDNAKKGDKIEFGRYPQSSNGDINDPNTYEPLTWIVTRKAEDKSSLYLTPEKVIDNQEMDMKTFSTSKLDTFLNGDFYNKAFNDEEHKAMQCVFGSELVHPLTIYFAQNFNTPESRCCKPTDYAIANGISISDNGYSLYWYEFPNIKSGYFGAIGSDGECFYTSVPDKLGVRPEIAILFK